MTKLDLSMLRELKETAQTLRNQALAIEVHIASLGMFCDQCGETEPESSFYPLGIGGTGSISGYLCNDCATPKEE
ncbi:MAG: hypothetical protein GWN58_68540 [Anaerolineae bacterium]|nr:hypothetical protein [Anaerolineae bacterium]